MKPVYFQCKTCKGTRQVPKRDYVALCGYNNCKGVIRNEREAVAKKRWWRRHWTFRCPVCGILFAEYRLIKWPMIPCPDCE